MGFKFFYENKTVISVQNGYKDSNYPFKIKQTIFEVFKLLISCIDQRFQDLSTK